MKGRSKRHWVFLRPVSPPADSPSQRRPKPLSKDYTSCLLCGFSLFDSFSSTATAMVSGADAASIAPPRARPVPTTTKNRKHLKLSALHQLTAVAALGIQAESCASWSKLASEQCVSMSRWIDGLLDFLQPEKAPPDHLGRGSSRIRLKLVDDICGRHKLVEAAWLVACPAPGLLAAEGVIPAQFQATDDVFPEVILGGRSKSQRTIWVGGITEAIDEELLLTSIPQIFTTEVKTEFIGGLVAQITGDRPGFPSEIVDIKVVKRCPHSQTRDRRRQRAAYIIAGAVLVVVLLSFVLIETIDDTGIPSGAGHKSPAIRRGYGD